MENKPLELRMYFFVPYQLTGIQQAIQSGHAALEYARKYGDTSLFKDFVDNWKTWIILNGGTTSDKKYVNTYFGSLNQIEADIINFNYDNNSDKIDISYFREPDLNDALTAVCFICDERVFNRKDYPDFVDWLLEIKMYADAKDEALKNNPEYWVKLKLASIEFIQEKFSVYYLEWIDFIGGKKNEFLRNLIKDKKLA